MAITWQPDWHCTFSRHRGKPRKAIAAGRPQLAVDIEFLCRDCVEYIRNTGLHYGIAYLCYRLKRAPDLDQQPQPHHHRDHPDPIDHLIDHTTD